MPKCLVQVGGCTLLDRYLDALDTLGVPATIVVGHAAAAVEAHFAGRATKPALVMNQQYLRGSIVSLAVGLATGDGDLLLLDGDVAFTPSMLERLARSPTTDALLVDMSGEFTDEQYMAGLRGNRVVTLHRAPADGHESQGEWVGFAKLSADAAGQLRESINSRIARGDDAGGYEDALAGLLASVDVTFVPTDGEPWTEIDFPADLARARELFG